MGLSVGHGEGAWIQSVGPGQVDDANAGGHQRRRQLQARLVRCGEEDQLARVEDPGFGWLDEAREAEVGKRLRQRPTGARPPGDRPQRQRRRAAQQAQQLTSSVAGAAHYTDLDTHAVTVPVAA
jgi:hypothetical protein